MRLILVSASDVEAAAHDLCALGPTAIRILVECVEHTGIRRRSISLAVTKLESAGFVLVRGDDGRSPPFWGYYEIVPTLAGEEALAWYSGEDEDQVGVPGLAPPKAR